MKMRDVIDRILDGELQQSTGVLDFSCSKVEIRLAAGEDYEGAFKITGPDNQLTEGYVYAGGLGMECITQEFSGVESEITFCFHARNDKENDNRQGEFIIISNHGEYTLPWQATVVRSEITSSLGPVKNLFHFTNLAKTNWEEATTLFYSDSFQGLFHGADRQYYPIYKGLSGLYDLGSEKKRNEQNMEEFLLAVKKKQTTEYLISETVIYMDAPEQLSGYTLGIHRNGWGYTCLHVEAEGDFIILDKETIREEDFLGNFYRLSYSIAPEYLHAGCNMGRIRLSNAYVETEIPVTVMNRTGNIKRKSLRRSRKNSLLELMEHYASFRTKKINTAAWRKQSYRLVDQMIAADEKDIAAQLFRAQILITEERYNEANWILNRTDILLADDDGKEPALWCYFRYLTALSGREGSFIEEAASQIERIYLRNKDNWRIAWLLTYLQEEYRNKPAAKWALWEEQFKRGCTSPVIYIEALTLLQQNPTLLMKLEPFETQLLLYAVRKNLITKELAGQISYLASKSKEYSDFLYRILQACYQADPNQEVLKAVCSLLIKGNKTGTAYLLWYRRGIEKEIRVTRLFEYFFLSLDLEKEEKIPKMVLMYFSYHCDLDYRHQAYLYAYIHKYREELPELFAVYAETIDRFVVRQMSKGRMNQWLAYLYKNCITPGMVTGENAEGLAEALFTVQIDMTKPGIREIIVIYDKGKTEITWPVTGRQMFLPLYGNDCHIFLADAAGNRYIGEGNCRVEKLIWPDKLARLIAPMVKNRPAFDLWLCEKGEEIAPVIDTNRDAMVRVLQTEYMSETCRREVRIRLIRYFYDNDMIAELDRSLGELTPDRIEDKNHAEVLKLMILRFQYFQAFEWMKTTGNIELDARLVMRVLSGMMGMGSEMMDEDRSMTLMAYKAFTAGKYDEKLLQYLGRFYQGNIRQLRNIWKASVDFGLDTCELSERLLIQMLYSDSFVGERVAIFKDYVAGGGGSDVEMAFLVQCSYEYFIGGKVMDVFVIRRMEKEIGSRDEGTKVCRLACIKYFAEHPEEMEDRTAALVSAFLKELIGQNIYFSFFKDYAGVFPFMEQFFDKTIIEYQARPGRSTVIHYLLEQDGVERSEYIKEEMRDMYGGICARQFVLFFGDRLLYYIAEKEEGEEIFTESASISRSDIVGEQRECKFNQINDIEIARTLQDYEAADSLLYEFYRREFMTREMFYLL